MTAAEYRAAIAALGLTQESAAALFGAVGRTGQRWARSGPPLAVAMLLVAGFSYDDLVALHDDAKIDD